MVVFVYLVLNYENMLSGPLLGEMIDHMVKKSQKMLKPDRKVWMYSAHDQTIANFLMALKLFEPHCPPYVATVLVELRISSKNQYFVTVGVLLKIHILKCFIHVKLYTYMCNI